MISQNNRLISDEEKQDKAALLKIIDADHKEIRLANVIYLLRSKYILAICQEMHQEIKQTLGTLLAIKVGNALDYIHEHFLNMKTALIKKFDILSEDKSVIAIQKSKELERYIKIIKEIMRKIQQLACGYTFEHLIAIFHAKSGNAFFLPGASPLMSPIENFKPLQLHKHILPDQPDKWHEIYINFIILFAKNHYRVQEMMQKITDDIGDLSEICPVIRKEIMEEIRDIYQPNEYALLADINTALLSVNDTSAILNVQNLFKMMKKSTNISTDNAEDSIRQLKELLQSPADNIIRLYHILMVMSSFITILPNLQGKTKFGYSAKNLELLEIEQCIKSMEVMRKIPVKQIIELANRLIEYYAKLSADIQEISESNKKETDQLHHSKKLYEEREHKNLIKNTPGVKF